MTHFIWSVFGSNENKKIWFWNLLTFSIANMAQFQPNWNGLAVILKQATWFCFYLPDIRSFIRSEKGCDRILLINFLNYRSEAPEAGGPGGPWSLPPDFADISGLPKAEIFGRNRIFLLFGFWLRPPKFYSRYSAFGFVFKMSWYTYPFLIKACENLP